VADIQPDNQWLIAYLNEVLSLEAEIHSTKELMTNLESMRIRPMFVREEFVPPDKPKQPTEPAPPPMPIKDRYISSPTDVFIDAVTEVWESVKELGVIAAVVLAGVGLFAAIMWSLTFWLVILLPIIGIAIAFIAYSGFAILKRQMTADSDMDKYNAALRDREIQIRTNQLNYENLCRQMLVYHKKDYETKQQKFVDDKNNALVHNQLAFLFNKEIDNAKLLLKAQLIVMNVPLKNLYDMNVLYPKYRNLIAVSSITEYLDSGRCKDLEEAYGEYEQESRQDRIIHKLDVIIQKLDEIEKMQYRLFIEMSRVNQNLSNIKLAIHDGFRILETQAKANTKRFLELSGDMAQMNLDMGNCFQEVEGYLAKLEKTSDKALAYLKEQKK